MKPILRSVEIPAGGRVIALSDIHGHAHYFWRMIEKLDINARDTLFVVGDIIERGPCNLGALRAVMRMRDICQTHALMGNWEWYMCDLIREGSPHALYKRVTELRRSYPSNLLDECYGELGIRIESPEDVERGFANFQKVFRAELDFMRNLPTVIETDDYIFVHGGIPTQDMEELAKYEGTYALLKNDAFMEKGYRFSKYVVVGHWLTFNYCKSIPSFNPLIDRDSRIISIDGGCGVKQSGQLNAMIADSDGSIHFERCEDLPRDAALDFQAESADSRLFAWMEPVRVLEHGEEFSKIEHIETGYRMEILTQNLHQEGDGWVCYNATDYELGVQPGDKLSVYEQTSRGVLAKKDGLLGWYRGRIAQ